METCEMSFIKYLLFIFNMVFVFSGIGIIVAGALVLQEETGFDHFSDINLKGPAVLLIVTGAIVFITAFLGCFGAVRESYNLLMAFAGILLIIFILELGAGIAAAVYKSDFPAFNGTLVQSLKNTKNSTKEREVWQVVQKKWNCCGVNGPRDWKNIAEIEPIPDSCCHDVEKHPPKTDEYCPNDLVVYETGCYDKLRANFNYKNTTLVGVGIGIAFVEVVGIFLACWLAYTIKKEQK